MRAAVARFVYRDVENFVETTQAELHFPFGSGGPSDLDLGEAVRAAKLPSDYFGTLAKMRATLPPGRWAVSTHADDGIRVHVDKVLRIDRWAKHPRFDSATFTVGSSPTTIRVEQFELDGAASLLVIVHPAP